MDAIISGSAGKALLLNGEQAWLLSVNDLSAMVPIGVPSTHLHFGTSEDIQIVKNTTREQAVQALEAEHLYANALDLTLISFDPKLSKEVRGEALEVVDEFLEEDVVVTRLENLLYAKPLSDKADVLEALQICQAKQYSHAYNFLHQLKESQEGIREVYLAWESIPTSLFEGTEQTYDFHQILINEGFFRMLAVSRGSQPKINQFRLDFIRNASIQSLRDYREVLQHWVKPFLKGIDFDTLSKDIAEENDSVSFPKKGHKPRRRSFNRAVLFENTNKRKQAIIKAMQQHDYVRMRNLLEDLITQHMNSDGPKFAVKSLCDLAIEAKALGIYSLQLELTKRCVDLQPGDDWSWAQYSDALLRVHRLKEALEAYLRAEEFGAGLVAKSGRADVLKVMGRLDEALAEYNNIIATYPENAIAKNGRADVLKAMGRFDEALAEYNTIIAAYPEDAFAKSGRADVLKVMGRFDEALAEYNTIMAEYPENAIVKNGRADVLKVMGRLDEALAEYNTIIATYPENAFAKNGRADVLKAMGRFDEALAEYNTIIAAYPENAIAKNGRADVLKVMGRLDEALAEYNTIIAAYPENAIAKNGRADVLKVMGRLDEALAEYNTIIAAYPENAIAKNGRADVLKVMGRLDEALAEYNTIIAAYPENAIAKNGRADVLKVMGRLDEALAEYNTIIAAYPEDAIAKSGRADVLKVMGRLDEALAEYNTIIAEFPVDAVARNGRSSVLLALRRYEEALEFLPDENLVTLSDWAALHLRGMILLRSGSIDEALSVFERGAKDDPWTLHREYFRTSLGIAYIRRRKFGQAHHVLKEIKSLPLQPQVNVYRLHSSGELQDDKHAHEAYTNITPIPYISNELVEELHRRYILKQEPQHDDDWVNEKEVNLLLLVSSQSAMSSQSYSY